MEITLSDEGWTIVVVCGVLEEPVPVLEEIGMRITKPRSRRRHRLTIEVGVSIPLVSVRSSWTLSLNSAPCGVKVISERILEVENTVILSDR